MMMMMMMMMMINFYQETREAFNNEAAATGKDRLLFTSAVGAGRSVIDSAYDVPAMAE